MFASPHTHIHTHIPTHTNAHTQKERGHIHVARTTPLPAQRKHLRPWTHRVKERETFSRNAKTSPQSLSQGSSVYPENNGPSLCTRAQNEALFWGMKCGAEGLRGPEVLSSGCTLQDFLNDRSVKITNPHFEEWALWNNALREKYVMGFFFGPIFQIYVGLLKVQSV